MSAGANPQTAQDPIRLELQGASFWSSEFSRERYGGSVFVDYKLPAGSIKASTFINGLNNDEFRRDFNKGQGFFNLNRSIESRITNTLSTVNSLQFEQKLFWNSKIDAGVSYTSANNKTPVHYGVGTSALSPSGFDSNTLPEELRRISRNTETIYPYEILAVANFVSDSSYFISSLSSRNNTFFEDELTSFINWEIPAQIGDHISIDFKMGGKYRKKSREYDESDRGHGMTVGGQEELRQFIYQNNPDLDFGMGRFTRYVQNNFSTFYLLSSYDQMILAEQFRQRGFMQRSIMEQIIGQLDDDNWSVTQTGQHPRRDIPNDYSGSEEIKAGYAMAAINVSRYFQLVGGARYEDITTNYRSFGIRESGVYDFTMEEFDDSLAIRNNSFLLPMVNARLMPFNWLQLRFAYTQSIARSRYYSYMPRYTLDRLKFLRNLGNPYLKPALSHNLDAYFSIRVNNPNVFSVGVLTAGVFQKKLEGYEYVKNYVNIHDSINNRHPYNVIADNRNVPISIPINNPIPAYSRGMEIDWQGSFIYLPRPFNGLVFTANYTYTDTEQTQHVQLVKREIPNPATPWIVNLSVVDSTYKDQLFRQPKHIINASLGYDLGGFSARVAYTRTAEAFVGYNGSGRIHPENRRLSQMQELWDLSVTQHVPWIKGLQLFFNMSNITSTFNVKEFVNVTNGGDPYPLYEEYFGRLTIVGLRYTF
jgi:TonB-dependent receptor